MYQSISGFPEYSPEEQIKFNQILQIITEEYERAGAVPIETPTVERISTLEGKSSNDKEVYGLRRLAAESGQDSKVDLALRFDLTVPLARYVSQHSNDLVFPFKRYHVGAVFRGERPQKGRYRQFLQCDIDTVGDGSISLLNDAEMPVVIYNIFTRLEIGHFKISVNNRKILAGFLESINFGESEVGKAIKIIDNLDKVGFEETKKELISIGASGNSIESLINFFSMDGSTDEIISKLKEYKLNNTFDVGVEELITVVNYLRLLGLPDDYFNINLSIARGLDYYTGTVYETRLTSHPKIGSICSGGRYDHLLKKLGANKDMPGVGISIGLSRVFNSLVESGVIKIGKPTLTDVLVTTMDETRIGDYLSFGSSLRKAGINTEVYSEPHKLAKQMKYANKKGIKIVVIAGESEFSEDQLTIRTLDNGEEIKVARALLVETSQKLLDR